MARIRWINESEATGEAARVYAEWLAAHPGRPRIPDILKCFSLRPDFFRDVVAVSDARIFEAKRLIHHHLGVAVEPSGAVGVAAILDDPDRFAGRRVATVLCGGNLSPVMRERLLAA